MTKQLELGMILSMNIHSGADHYIKEQDENGTQCRGEEKDLGTSGPSPSTVIASPTDKIQHNHGSDTHGSIKIGGGKVLKGVDNDPIGRDRGADLLCLAQHFGHLTGNDINGGTSHEGTDGGKWDKVNDET